MHMINIEYAKQWKVDWIIGSDSYVERCCEEWQIFENWCNQLTHVMNLVCFTLHFIILEWWKWTANNFFTLKEILLDNKDIFAANPHTFLIVCQKPPIYFPLNFDSILLRWKHSTLEQSLNRKVKHIHGA